MENELPAVRFRRSRLHSEGAVENHVMKAAIYARVSTDDQDCEIQLANLRAFVRRWQWPPAVEYVEKLSGKEGNRRPELERLLEAGRMREIDVVIEDRYTSSRSCRGPRREGPWYASLG
jgi:predicted site-specific integrase-resolvase